MNWRLSMLFKCFIIKLFNIYHAACIHAVHHLLSLDSIEMFKSTDIQRMDLF